jgi:hypothetical protein
MKTIQLIYIVAAFASVSFASSQSNGDVAKSLKEKTHVYMKRQAASEDCMDKAPKPVDSQVTKEQTVNGGNDCFDEAKEKQTPKASQDKSSDEDCTLTSAPKPEPKNEERESESVKENKDTSTSSAPSESNSNLVQVDGKWVDPKWYFNGAGSGVDNSKLVDIDGTKVNPKDYLNGSGRSNSD